MNNESANNSPSENNAPNNDTLQRRGEAADSAAVTEATATATKATAASEQQRHARQRPSQPINDDTFSSAATAANTNIRRPHITPCSLKPKWSKRRIRIASCGCLSSITICTARLLLDPGPSAYIIHSIIILFDMILIHVFTNTLWLSMAGEVTAIIFATCFHLTHEKIFELVETTLIAVLVSFHMIKSRNEHWDREDELERDMIGLQFYVEHHANNIGSVNDAEVDTSVARRRSSLSKLDNDYPTSNNNSADCDAMETGACASHADTKMSSFSTSRSTRKGAHAANGERSSWWHHFFDHFLDGSAGVMYTSFLGLIIDEIVNFRSAAKY